MPIKESTRKAVSGILLAISISVTAIVVLAFVVVMGFTYEVGFKLRDVALESSPNGEHLMILQAKGEPFLFSSTPALLTLKEGERIVSEECVSIADDGSMLRPSNWSVSWDDDRAIITLHGSEQADKTVTMYFNGAVDSPAR